ncbi:unnamed protein product, partial [Prorocentrum cordatum]
MAAEMERNMRRQAKEENTLEDIDARILKLETDRDNLVELIVSLLPSRQRGSEEAQTRVNTLSQQSEQANLSAETDLVRLERLRELELPAIPAFPSLEAVVDDIEISLEDYLEGKTLSDQLATAVSPDGKAAALLASKDFMFRTALAQAPQWWGAVAGGSQSDAELASARVRRSLALGCQ